MKVSDSSKHRWIRDRAAQSLTSELTLANLCNKTVDNPNSSNRMMLGFDLSRLIGKNR